MKILFIDIGNTRLKWMLMDENKSVARGQFAYQRNGLAECLNSHWAAFERPAAIYVSNVAGETIAQGLDQFCQSHWNHKPNYATVSTQSCGVTNSYVQTAKLGVDRWLAMIAAWDICHDSVCILDCGSAITLDLIDKDGLHQGGIIAPGLRLLRRSLSDNTHALPDESSDHLSGNSILANNTKDAIHSGCQIQFIAGIEFLVNTIDRQFGREVKYIITGGDAERVLETIDREMIHQPDLILKGLELSIK